MNTTTFPDSWGDLWKSDQPLDFEAFLKSDLLAARRSEIKTQNIIMPTTGSVSTIVSTCLILYILRSHHGLSTTYHRLVFGLSVADISSSFAYVLSSTMVPKEMKYIVPGAQGNTTTCTLQGSLFVVAYTIGAAYNCSICFYYLAIIRYNKKNEYIRNKLEPWFHGISILFPLVVGFICIAMKGYNEYGAVCHLVPNYPPHCIGYKNGDTPEGFSIPCGRGDGGENPILYLVTLIVGSGSTLIITPTVIVVTMLLMYRSVSKIEQSVQNYGVMALRLNARRSPGNHDDNTETNGDYAARILRRIKKLVRLPALRTQRATSKRRAILHMAAGYALSWTFVFVPFRLPYFFHKSHATETLNSFLTPLQGLFNFLVLMSPRVRNAKRSIRERKKLTWRQAFIKAYMSRGERRRIDRNLSSRNTRTGSWAWTSLMQRAQSSLNSVLSRTSTPRRDMRSNDESNARTTTKNDQSSTNPTQVSAPAEKLSSTNPHLPDDMKEAEGSNTLQRPQQEEYLATDGDDEEKCEEEQKGSSRLR